MVDKTVRRLEDIRERMVEVEEYCSTEALRLKDSDPDKARKLSIEAAILQDKIVEIDQVIEAHINACLNDQSKPPRPRRFYS